MRSTEKEMQAALQFASNALNMSLTWDRDAKQIVGRQDVRMGWFGSDLTLPVRVIDSLVDEDRGIVLLAFVVSGSLGGVLFVDSVEKKALVFLVDGAKLGMTKPVPESPLPKYWVRGWLYRKIVSALKVTYSTTYLSGVWGNERRGNTWMQDYLSAKLKDAKDRSLQL